MAPLAAWVAEKVAQLELRARRAPTRSAGWVRTSHGPSQRTSERPGGPAQQFGEAEVAAELHPPVGVELAGGRLGRQSRRRSGEALVAPEERKVRRSLGARGRGPRRCARGAAGGLGGVKRSVRVVWVVMPGTVRRPSAGAVAACSASAAPGWALAPASGEALILTTCAAGAVTAEHGTRRAPQGRNRIRLGCRPRALGRPAQLWIGRSDRVRFVTAAGLSGTVGVVIAPGPVLRSGLSPA